MNRNFRAERKAFIRAEKRSVKRQRQELRRIKRSRRWFHLNERYQQTIESLKGLTGKGGTSSFRNELQATYLNTMALFVIAFWAVYFLGQLVTLVVANYFSIPAVLYSYHTEWPLFTYSPAYTILNLILIFGSGPLVCLLTALVSFRIYKSRITKRSRLNTFLLWITFHGVNLFFGAYIAGVFTRSGLVFASAWIFRSMPFDPEEIVFLVVAAIVLLSAGYFLAHHLLAGALSPQLQKPVNRGYLLAAVVVLPWLTGTAIILLINTPQFPGDFLLLLGISVLMIVPGFFIRNSPASFDLDEAESIKGVVIDWMTILIFVSMLILIRLLVFPGISIH